MMSFIGIFLDGSVKGLSKKDNFNYGTSSKGGLRRGRHGTNGS